MNNWKKHPVVQLFLARYREFIRQPKRSFGRTSFRSS